MKHDKPSIMSYTTQVNGAYNIIIPYVYIHYIIIETLMLCLMFNIFIDETKLLQDHIKEMSKKFTLCPLEKQSKSKFFAQLYIYVLRV